MGKSFLFYWIREQIEAAVDRGALLHAASNQFDRVSAGDVIWIVGPGRSAGLVTIGPLSVRKVVGLEEARRSLKYVPWDAKFHALADAGVAPREVSLDSSLQTLEFVSKNSRLDTRKPVAQQLQTMRELTQSAATVLEHLWKGPLRTGRAFPRSLTLRFTPSSIPPD